MLREDRLGRVDRLGLDDRVATDLDLRRRRALRDLHDRPDRRAGIDDRAARLVQPGAERRLTCFIISGSGFAGAGAP